MNRILLLPVLLICGSILGGEKDYADYRYNYNSCSLSGQAITRSEIRNKAIPGLQGRPDFIYEKDDDHKTWHNGDNTDLCIMNSPVEDIGYGEPAENWVGIFNQALFCEGHRERAMNVSWSLGKITTNENYWPYTPIGEKSGSSGAGVIASRQSSAAQKPLDQYIAGNLDIKLEIEYDHFIKRKTNTLYLVITNKSNETIELPRAGVRYKFHYLDKGYEFHHNKMGGLRGASYPLAAKQTIYKPLTLTDMAVYAEGIGFLPGRAYYWPEGAYTVQCFIEGENINMASDKINFIIDAVPEKYEEAFNDLKKIHSRPENYELFYQKHKDTIYRQEFMEEILRSGLFMDAIASSEESEFKTKVQQLYEEYILSYPNSLSARIFFGKINMYYDHNRQFLATLYQKVKAIDTLKTSHNRNLLLKNIKLHSKTTFKKLTNNGEK